jgi:hypothetical protein
VSRLQLQAGLPASVLVGGSVLSFEAIDPTTGAAVSGVTVSGVAVYGVDVSADTTTLEDAFPLYTPEEVGGIGE